MGKRLKVMTVIGTRPEIIRLSATIKALDRYTDHVLVHTGQNYDYELNEIFFEDLRLRRPSHFLHADTSSLGAALGSILTRIEKVIVEERPDAFLVLGDTNSCISALMAKRLKVPVFHMEAGNRSFDENVPEETNRRLIDHISDYNLVYTEHARRNLLGEGLHPSRVILTGSPMKEVLDQQAERIGHSTALADLQLEDGGYFLVSMHREENVDHPARLQSLLAALAAVADEYGLPVLMSTHPRTRKRIDAGNLRVADSIVLHPPLGFSDYLRLQQGAKCVLSDSGTIAEESTILGFPAVTLRDAIERPEAIEAGGIVVTGTRADDICESVRMVIDEFEVAGGTAVPTDYQIDDVSRRVVNTIRSHAATHHQRSGVRVV